LSSLQNPTTNELVQASQKALFFKEIRRPSWNPAVRTKAADHLLQAQGFPCTARSSTGSKRQTEPILALPGLSNGTPGKSDRREIRDSVTAHPRCGSALRSRYSGCILSGSLSPRTCCGGDEHDQRKLTAHHSDLVSHRRRSGPRAASPTRLAGTVVVMNVFSTVLSLMA